MFLVIYFSNQFLERNWREQLEQLRTDLLRFPLPPWERICKDLNIKFSPDQAVA